MKSKTLLTSVILLAMPFSSAVASEGLNSGDTAWMIVSTALVMMMTPAGLALFYGGMSRYKNLLNTFAMTFVSYCLASVIWMMWGYSIAFGPDKAGITGSLTHVFMAGIGVDSLSGSIPTYVFAHIYTTLTERDGWLGQLWVLIAGPNVPHPELYNVFGTAFILSLAGFSYVFCW